MAVDPKQKLEALNAELKQIVDNYNEATKVAENCKQKIFELKGAINAIQDILEPEKTTDESS